MTNEKGMELPIAVMIVFFVSIAVALIVINFAGQLIGLGETQLKQFSLQSDKADFFVEAQQVGNNTVAMLATQCYNTNKGTYGIAKICYIVHQAAKEPISFNPTEVAAQFHQATGLDPAVLGSEQIFFDEWDGTSRTIYIEFDDISQTVAVAS